MAPISESIVFSCREGEGRLHPRRLAPAIATTAAPAAALTAAMRCGPASFRMAAAARAAPAGTVWRREPSRPEVHSLRAFPNQLNELTHRADLLDLGETELDFG